MYYEEKVIDGKVRVMVDTTLYVKSLERALGLLSDGKMLHDIMDEGFPEDVAEEIYRAGVEARTNMEKDNKYFKG